MVLSEGRRLRDRGIALVDEAEHDQWKADTDAEILRLAGERLPFTAEDVSLSVGRPQHPNAMGARFKYAERHGVIVPAGFTQAVRGPAHARVLRLWVGAR